MLESVSSAAHFAPQQFLGIPIALVGAAFLSLGAQLQHRGVSRVEASTEVASGGLRIAQLVALLRRPSWVIGTLMLALAVIFQLTSLFVSALIVVQPLGAVALVITAMLNARLSGIRLNRRSVIAVVLCVSGVGCFVVVAAIVARDTAVASRQIVVVLLTLVAVLVVCVVAFLLLRRRMRALVYIVAAGVIYGFVATLAKIVLGRLKHENVDGLTLLCAIGVVAATVAGAYLVQNAYSSGPPDLVIAGLTVVDPLVAVTVGILVLHEAPGAPWWAVVLFVASAAAAIAGVRMLSKYHPQSQS